MTYPSTEFDPGLLAEKVIAMAPTEPKRRVRLQYYHYLCYQELSKIIFPNSMSYSFTVTLELELLFVIYWSRT